MLLDLAELVRKHGLKVTGVIHAGAHLAEEAAEYQRLFGTAPVWWIEGNADVIPKIRQTIRRYPNQQVIEALLWEEDAAAIPFNVTNYDGMSSSILDFGTHPQFSPDTVFVDHRTLPARSLDSLVAEHGITGCNLLNMDLQGVELHCLLGAEALVADDLEYIYTEVNTAEVYRRCAKVGELDHHLSQWAFERVEMSIVKGQGWGDALYVRRTT